MKLPAAEILKTKSMFFFPTHDAEVFHVRVSGNLLAEPVVGELFVNHLLVPRADEPVLLVQEHGGWTTKEEIGSRLQLEAAADVLSATTVTYFSIPRNISVSQVRFGE